MQEQVNDIQKLYGLLEAVMKSGAVTNGLPGREVLEREIKEHTLYAYFFNTGVFLLRKRDGFQRLNYLVTRNTPLPAWLPGRRTVLELPFRQKDKTAAAYEEAWNRLGFIPSVERIQLIRQPAQPSPEGHRTAPLASRGQEEEIVSFLESCFNPLTACLPTRFEVEDAVSENRIYYNGESVLHWRTVPRGTEIRHLASGPLARGKGNAHCLIQSYLAECGSRPSFVWTEEHGAARHIYEEFGYQENGWRSHVLIWSEGGNPV